MAVVLFLTAMEGSLLWEANLPLPGSHEVGMRSLVRVCVFVGISLSLCRSAASVVSARKSTCIQDPQLTKQVRGLCIQT
ncbi:MAG: hypothetical protein SGPRY_010564 [Prymnesium sp.]